MGFTKIQVVARALMLVGSPVPANSLAPQSDIMNAALVEFDSMYPTLLSLGKYRFATKIQVLSQLVDGPPIRQYQYAYEMPGDCLAVVRLWPYTGDYQIYANSKIYCNLSGDIEMEYIFPVDISLTSNAFGIYLSYYIAKTLSMCSAYNVQFSQKNEIDMIAWQSKTAALDAQNSPNQRIESNPVIIQRGIGWSPNDGYGGDLV